MKSLFLLKSEGSESDVITVPENDLCLTFSAICILELLELCNQEVR